MPERFCLAAVQVKKTQNANLKVLSSFDLNFVCYSGSNHPISHPDAGVLADIKEWRKSLASYSSQYVGQTLVYLNGTFEECRYRECNLGNLICDAMVRSTRRNHVLCTILRFYSTLNTASHE